MNRKLILRLLGAMLSIVALAMIPALILALIFRDGDAPVLAACIGGLLVPGLLIWFLVHPGLGTHLRLREGFLVVALGWLVLSVGGALPFFFSGLYPRFEDALFESVSGFTTTGATVLLEYEHFPRGIMFWRATTHWIGGMGADRPYGTPGPGREPRSLPPQACAPYRCDGKDPLSDLYPSDFSRIPGADALRPEYV